MKPNKMFIVANDQKCGCCNWRVSNLYLMAESWKKTKTLREIKKDGGAALCGDCMCELLTDSGHAIYPSKNKRNLVNPPKTPQNPTVSENKPSIRSQSLPKWVQNYQQSR